VNAYDPVDGQIRELVPARQFMKVFLLHSMADFGVDGLRLDSINNIANWDFVQEFKELARGQWRGTPDRFLVVSEELSVPRDLLKQRRLDGLWNEDFKRLARHAILGTNDTNEPSFEWMVRKLIDCRLMGFDDAPKQLTTWAVTTSKATATKGCSISCKTMASHKPRNGSSLPSLAS
jgi:pullulanase